MAVRGNERPVYVPPSDRDTADDRRRPRTTDSQSAAHVEHPRGPHYHPKVGEYLLRGECDLPADAEFISTRNGGAVELGGDCEEQVSPLSLPNQPEVNVASVMSSMSIASSPSTVEEKIEQFRTASTTSSTVTTADSNVTTTVSSPSPTSSFLPHELTAWLTNGGTLISTTGFLQPRDGFSWLTVASSPSSSSSAPMKSPLGEDTFAGVDSRYPSVEALARASAVVNAHMLRRQPRLKAAVRGSFAAATVSAEEVERMESVPEVSKSVVAHAHADAVAALANAETAVDSASSADTASVSSSDTTTPKPRRRRTLEWIRQILPLPFIQRRKSRDASSKDLMDIVELQDRLFHMTNHKLYPVASTSKNTLVGDISSSPTASTATAPRKTALCRQVLLHNLLIALMAHRNAGVEEMDAHRKRHLSRLEHEPSSRQKRKSSAGRRHRRASSASTMRKTHSDTIAVSHVPVASMNDMQDALRAPPGPIPNTAGHARRHRRRNSISEPRAMTMKEELLLRQRQDGSDDEDVDADAEDECIVRERRQKSLPDVRTSIAAISDEAKVADEAKDADKARHSEDAEDELPLGLRFQRVPTTVAR